METKEQDELKVLYFSFDFIGKEESNVHKQKKISSDKLSKGLVRDSDSQAKSSSPENVRASISQKEIKNIEQSKDQRKIDEKNSKIKNENQKIKSNDGQKKQTASAPNLRSGITPPIPDDPRSLRSSNQFKSASAPGLYSANSASPNAVPITQDHEQHKQYDDSLPQDLEVQPLDSKFSKNVKGNLHKQKNTSRDTFQNDLAGDSNSQEKSRSPENVGASTSPNEIINHVQSKDQRKIDEKNSKFRNENHQIKSNEEQNAASSKKGSKNKGTASKGNSIQDEVTSGSLKSVGSLIVKKSQQNSKSDKNYKKLNDGQHIQSTHELASDQSNTHINNLKRLSYSHEVIQDIKDEYSSHIIESPLGKDVTQSHDSIIKSKKLDQIEDFYETRSDEGSVKSKKHVTEKENNSKPNAPKERTIKPRPTRSSELRRTRSKDLKVN